MQVSATKGGADKNIRKSMCSDEVVTKERSIDLRMFVLHGLALTTPQKRRESDEGTVSAAFVGCIRACSAHDVVDAQQTQATFGTGCA